MSSETLRVEIEDGVARLILDRPPVNALDSAMRRDLIRAIDRLSWDPDVRAVVLTGAGSVFCAGADLKEREGFVGNRELYAEYYRDTQACFAAIRDFPKPVVCAINGGAVGGGLALVAGCDILLASDNAFLAMPEIKIGIAAGAAQLNHLFPRSAGRRLAFTGGRVDARELYRLGVVETCTAPAELMPAAMAIARQIAEHSPTVLRAAKTIYDTVESLSYAESIAFQIKVQAGIAESDDVREARKALQEKRAPRYTGR